VADDGPIVLGWEADLSSVLNVSDGAAFRMVAKIRTDDTHDVRRIRERFAKHATGATVFRRSPELLQAIRTLAEESWR
jgi:hypothetical protein